MAEHDNRSHIVDRARTAGLIDVGCTEFDLATVVDCDGECHLALIRRNGVGDTAVKYDASCSAVKHEQLGPLGLETLRRINNPPNPPSDP